MKLKNIFSTPLRGRAPFYIGVFAAGVFCGWCLQQKFPFKLKEEVDLISVLSLLCTFLIALIVTHFGRQRTDELRYAKNIIIDHTKEAVKQSRELLDTFQFCCQKAEECSNQEKQREVIIACRKLSNQIYEIGQLIKLSEIGHPTNDSHDDCSKKYLNFKESLTGISWVPDLRKSGLTNPASQGKCDASCRELKKALFNLIIVINQS